jgi:2-polyprenyl-3-methyl-5-hydroxy-6-metoxy-1,4-benzoquinol methylase
MSERTVTPEDLDRLKSEREEADRRYLEALTALDSAAHSIEEYPHPPPALDEHQITPLNQLWNVVEQHPVETDGLKGRLRSAVWNVVGRSLQQQQQFNAALVDHLNRNIVTSRETQKSVASVIALFREHLSSFELHVMALLQRLTPYVDSKDLESAALLRRIAEDTRELVEFQGVHLADRGRDLIRVEVETKTELTRLDNELTRLANVINGIGDEMLKRWESSVTRDERLKGSIATVAGRFSTIEEALSTVRQSTQVLKREVERAMAAPGAAAGGVSGGTSATTTAPATAGDPLGLTVVDSHKYVGFENRFRGSEDEIRLRQRDYLRYFEGASDVLDVGCGRGEFLHLLRESGIRAHGIDINHEMVELCRARGLDASEDDALGYLSSREDASLGGLIALQVVEHLEPAYLMRFLDAAFLKMRPGSHIILETINPSCWFAFFESYIRDLTHVRAIHPDTLKYLLTASGFEPVEVQFRAPYPDHGKLRMITAPPEATLGQRAVSEVVSENADKVNRLLFGYMDYAAVGTK